MRISDWSSDVCSSDLPILIFDPETLSRRSRDDPGEAAVRIARRMTEILSARTGDGHVLRVDLRLRPHPEVTPIVLPESAAISYYESEALAWEQRSEEHMSELQSLMRISYAVFCLKK